MTRGHSNVTKWKYYRKRRGIWEHTCGQMESWGRRWWIHFEGCPEDCLLPENKLVTTDNNQHEEKAQKRPCSCTFKWKFKEKKKSTMKLIKVSIKMINDLSVFNHSYPPLTQRWVHKTIQIGPGAFCPQGLTPHNTLNPQMCVKLSLKSYFCKSHR